MIQILTMHQWILHINGLIQDRCNSIANTLELCLSYTNPTTSYNTIGILLYQYNRFVLKQCPYKIW